MFRTNVRLLIRKDFQSKYLKLRGWSMTDLANHLKYPKQQVSQTLSGAVEPSMQFLHRLCTLTRIPVKDLIETVFEK